MSSSFSLPPEPIPSSSLFDRFKAAIGIKTKAKVEQELQTFKIHHSAEPIIDPHEPSPSPPLASHKIAPTPLKTVENLKAATAEEKKEFEVNQTNLKIQKTRAKKLGLAAIPLIILGIPLLVIPPLGGTMLAGGVLLAAGSLSKLLKSNLTDSQREKAETMDRALTLLDQDPDSPLSFSKFLADCPKVEDPELGTSYRTEDLDTYISLFEMHLQRHHIQQEDLPKIQAELDSLKNDSPELAALKDDISAMMDKFDVGEADYPKVKERLTRESTQLNNRKVTLETKQSELQTSKGTLEPQITALKGEIATSNAKLADLQANSPDSPEIEPLEEEIQTKTRDVSTKESQLHDLEENLSFLHTDLSNIAQEAEGLEKQMTDIAALDAKIQERNTLQKQENKGREDKKKQIEASTQKIKGLDTEIETGKARIKRYIEFAGAPPYDDIDLRTKNDIDPTLFQMREKWIQNNKPTENIVVHLKLNPAKPAIFHFGHLAAKPSHALEGSDPEAPIGPTLRPKLKGEYLKITKERYKELGRTASNDFLSNAYVKDIEIDGETYPSITHYLLIQKAQKLIDRKAPSFDDPYPVLNKDQKKALESLKEKIKKSPTAEEAVHAAKEVMQTKIGGAWQADEMFKSMDGELKKALFCKFVGADGKLTLEGQKLVDTGTRELYAGNEIGDPSYGLQFLDHGRMSGTNKLGVYLQELRGMLQERENPPKASPVEKAPAAAPSRANLFSDKETDPFAKPSALAPPKQAAAAFHDAVASSSEDEDEDDEDVFFDPDIPVLTPKGSAADVEDVFDLEDIEDEDVAQKILEEMRAKKAQKAAPPPPPLDPGAP